MAERLWVWFTHYPAVGSSYMAMMPATDFVPFYRQLAAKHGYVITRNHRVTGKGGIIRIYRPNGELVIDAEWL
jgi:hypothetical protein